MTDLQKHHGDKSWGGVGGTTPDNGKITRAWGWSQLGGVSQASQILLPQFSQGPRKQSCYENIFEKGFSGPMDQLKRFSFIQIKGLSPLFHHKYGRIHKHTHEESINYLALKSRITILNIFDYLQNSSSRAAFFWIWSNILAQIISSSWANKGHISNQSHPETQCGVRA